MDAPALTPDEARELEGLRRKAYGPAGDIAPGEFARLEQLEAAARPASPLPVIAETTVDASPAVRARFEASAVPELHDAEPDPLPDPETFDATVESGTLGAAPLVRRRRTRRLAVAAAAVAVVVTVLAWGVEQFTGPRADLALGMIATEEDPRPAGGQLGMLGSYDIDLDTIQQYESHRTLTTWSASARSGLRCLVIDAGSYGVVGVSCTPRGLDPSVDITIWQGMPDTIVGDLPSGSVIRYVLSGDRVLVSERAADTAL